MPEDKNINPLAIMKDAGMESMGFTPFASAPQNKPLNQIDITDPYQEDYSLALQEIASTDIRDMIPGYKDQKRPDQSAPKLPPTAYGNKADLEKYIYQDDFEGKGFNPMDTTNYDRWVAKETWGSSLSKGFDSFGEKFNQTFTDYWKDYGRMVNSLVHADAVKLMPSESDMISQNYQEHLTNMKNFVFIPEEDEDAIFSKRSMSEFIANAGFAMGTMAAVSLELLGDALITAATAGGGIGTFGATFARIGGKALFKMGAKETGKKVLKKGVIQTGKREAAVESAKTGLGKGNFFTGLLLADEGLDVIKGTDNLKKVNQMTKNPSAVRSMKKAQTEFMNKTTQDMLTGSEFLNKAWDITKKIPLAGTSLKYGEKVVAGLKAGRGFGEVSGIAFKGLRRLGQEYNLAATEASFEAISSYGATMEQMINQHYLETGKEVDPATFERMRKMAGNASFANYGTNMAILLASNQIMFGAMFNKFKPSNKILREMIDGNSNSILRVSRRGGKGIAEKLYDKSGFFGTYGLVGKISSDFGKKQAMYEVGKQFGKGFLKFEVSEGVQENMQEMSNYAWQNYYAGKVNGVYKSLDRAFEEGAAEQFTKQGFKTFLMGALTGSLIRGPVHVMQYVGQKATEYSVERAYAGSEQASPLAQAKESRLKNINTVNDFAQHVADNNLDNSALSFATQANAAMDQTEAAIQGNEYSFVGGRDNSIIEAALAANRVGQIDALQSILKSMGENMTQEEFEASFKVALKDTKYSSVAEFTASVSTKIQNYSDRADEIRKQVNSKLINPEKYDVESDDYITAIIARKTQEDAIHIMALSELKANRAAERAKNVFDDYNSIESLAGSSDYVFRILSNPKNLQAELGNLEADIRILDESLQGSGLAKEERDSLRKEWQDKTKELDLLNKWVGLWNSREQINQYTDKETGAEQEGREVVLDAFIGKVAKEKVKVKQEDGSVKEEVLYETHHKDVKQLFKELINLKNKQAGLDARIYLKDMESGFDKVVDFIQLEQDAKDYMESVESLFSPEIYQETVARMQDGRYKSKLMEYADSMEYRIAYTVAEILKSSGEIVITIGRQGRPIVLFTGDITPEQFQEVRDKIIEDVTKSEAFENIMKVILSKDLGLSQSKYIQEQMKKIDEILKSRLKEELQEYVPEFQFDEPISNEVFKKFNEDNEDVDKKTLESIAKRISETNAGIDGLSPRQKEIYKKHSSKIDYEVVKFKRTNSNKEAKNTKQQPDIETQKRGVDLAVTDAITNIKENTVNNSDGSSNPIFNTVYKDLDGKEIRLEATSFEAINAKIIEAKAADDAKLQERSKMEVEETPPLTGTETPGDIPSDGIEDESAEDLLEKQKQEPKGEFSLKWNAINSEINILINLSMKGLEVTEDGKNIDEEIARLATELEELNAKYSKPVVEPQEPEKKEEGNTTVNNEDFENFKEDGEPTDEEGGEEGAFDLYDNDGTFITSYLTEKERDDAKAQMDQDLKDANFTENLLKEVTDSSIIPSIVAQMTQRLQDLMDKYNSSKEEGGKYTSLESFYNSSKIIQLEIHNKINDFVEVNPALIKKEEETEEKEVFSSPKTKQDVSQVVEETQSQQFNDSITELHNRLKDVGMPTTTQETGQIAIIFPENTTDFSNFEKYIPTEENALNQLKDIKFSCKK